MLITGNEPDFILISEVIPKAQSCPISPALLNVPGYMMYSNFDPVKPNLGASGIRGICIYVKMSLHVSEVVFEKTVFKEQVWVQMSLTGSDVLLLGCIYRSPSSSADDVHELGALLKLVTNSRYSHVLIAGDFNFPQINWKTGLSSAPLSHGSHAFIDILHDSFLYQHVENPTRFRLGDTPHTLDLIMSSEEAMVKNLEYLPGLGSSDHILLQFRLACYTPPVEPAACRLNLNRGNYKMLNQQISATNWAPCESEDVEGMYQFIKDKLTELSYACIPLAKPRQENKTIYINQEAMRLKKQKRTKWLTYMRTRDVIDYIRFTRVRNKLRTLTRNLRATFERQLVADIRSNVKGFWKYTGSRLRTKTRVEDLQAEDGTMARENRDKANVLNHYFRSIFTVEDPVLPEPPTPFTGAPLETIEVSSSAVREKLLKLRPDSSPGPDGLHPRILRETAVEMAEHWTRLFRTSLATATLPSDWCRDDITPIYKKGPKKCPANYRPVTLTAVPCKVLESLVRDQITEHLTHTAQLNTMQHGFRRKRSCSTQLLETLEDWSRELEDGNPVDALYLDFSKAFNSVPHQRLLLKLHSCGIRGRLLRWIRAFLTGRQQRVIVNGVKSDWAAVTSGVPQGTVLGPLLFLVYVNDLPENVSSVIKMFADDTKVYRGVSQASDIQALQSDLDTLLQWADRWQLPFNRAKCSSLHLGRLNASHVYRMGDTQLTQVLVEKDLGIQLDHQLKFREQAAAAIARASHILATIRRSFSVIDETTLPLLFRTMVRPHLEYANAIWGPFNRNDQKRIERVQRRATKLVASVRQLPYEERLRALNMPSLYHRRRRGDMITVYQVLRGGVHVDPSQFFSTATTTHTRGHRWKITKPRAVSRVRRNTFSVRVVNDWNALPSTVVDAPSVNAFKARLDKHWADDKYHIHIND